MRDRSAIERQLMEYGFTTWATLNASGTKTIQAIDKDGINTFVTIDEEETFKLQWLVPLSIAKVEIGPCSPFHSETHFMKMLRKMRSVISKLKEDDE